jgi:hypothetical protein
MLIAGNMKCYTEILVIQVPTFWYTWLDEFNKYWDNLEYFIPAPIVIEPSKLVVKAFNSGILDTSITFFNVILFIDVFNSENLIFICQVCYKLFNSF